MNETTTTMLLSADMERLSTYFPVMRGEDHFWSFTCFSRQNYADIVTLDAVDKIMLGIQCTRHGCLCELAIRWRMIGGKPVPQLEVFSDAWPILQTPSFAAVMDKLVDMRRRFEPTPDEVSALLIACGFKDQSDRSLDVSRVLQSLPEHRVPGQ